MKGYIGHTATVVVSGFSLLFMLLMTIGCKKEQLAEVIQKDVKGSVEIIEAYRDEQGELRVPTWLKYSGHVTIGTNVFESKTIDTVLLPKYLWMIEEIESLKKGNSCVTSYTYTQNSDFTVTESSYAAYVVNKDGCSGQRCWNHSVVVKTINTFHNNPVIVSDHYEIHGDSPCSIWSYERDYRTNSYPDNTYTAGSQFSAGGTWSNNFNSTCSGDPNDLEHVGIVQFDAGGGTGSATFDYMIIQATSAACEE